MSLMGIAKFEHFFRLSAGLDIDKADLKRYSDFVDGKIYDLLLRGQAAAKAIGRVTIEPFDLPITKGLQERINEFRNIDEQIELSSILDHLASRPPLDLAYSEEPEARLPEVLARLLDLLLQVLVSERADGRNWPMGGRGVRCRATDPVAANAMAGLADACRLRSRADEPPARRAQAKISSAFASSSGERTRTNKTSSVEVS